jgi:membrane protease YdiL (CAAX protease family)
VTLASPAATSSVGTRARRGSGPWPTAVLLSGFAGALAVRVALAGPAGALSTRATLAFAAALALLATLGRAGFAVSRRAGLVAAATTALLVAPAALRSAGLTSRPVGSFAGWAVVAVAVAGAEEALLRGALFDAVTRWRGSDLAVVVSAVAFALLHVPLYGWRAVPLDLAVGIALGAARLLAGTWTAPALAHVGADVAGWWLS